MNKRLKTEIYMVNKLNKTNNIKISINSTIN